MEIKVLGMDLGFGAAKAFTSFIQNEVVAPVSVTLPFVLTTYDGRTLDGMGGPFRVATRPDVLRVEGTQYLIGAGAEKYSSSFLEAGDMERLNGPEARLMSYAAWAKMFGNEHTVVIRQMIAGLPIAVYQAENTRALRDGVRSRFVGEHRFAFNDQTYHIFIEKVGVVPQALGAITDYFVDLNNRNIPGREPDLNPTGARDLLGVISLGNRTIDMILLQGTEILPMGTAGEPLGVRTLLEQVQSRMDGYSLGELDQRLRTGRLNCIEEKTLWLRQVADMVNRRWGSVLGRLSRIVMVGGGVHLLPHREGRPFPGAIGLPETTYIPDDPVLSVARGLYKIGLGKR